MKREHLEHVIRTAADIADDDEVMIIGSQSILGSFPQAPDELLRSNEADIYPKNKPERSDLIDGCIGEGSPFHDLYGYYAQGVGRETAILPQGWEQRLVPIRNANTRWTTGWCLEIHDLLLAKCVAAREKDLRFVQDVVKHGLATEEILLERLALLPIDPARKKQVSLRLEHALHAPYPPGP